MYDTLSINSASVTGTVGLVNFDTDGNLTYDPNGKFDHLNDGETATDTFTYTVQDDDDGQDTGTVTVTINGEGELPYQLTVMVLDGEMNEDGPDTGKVKFSLDRPAESAFNLSLLVVSTPAPPNAASAADLEPLTGSVSFGVGDQDVEVTFTPKDDDLIEVTEILSVEVLNHANIDSSQHTNYDGWLDVGCIDDGVGTGC